MTGGSVTEGGLKTGLEAMIDYLTGLMGADGALITANQTLGTALSGVVAKSGDYTTLAGDRGREINVDASGGNRTITLLDAATAGDGHVIVVRKSDASSGTVTASGVVLRRQGEAVLCVSNGAAWTTIPIVASAPPSVCAGLLATINVSDAEHDVDVAPGQCGLTVLASTMTKRLDATFAAGTGNGGMASGQALPTSGTVHGFLVTKDSDGSVDVMADVSVSGANVNAGWTVVRRVFSLLTDASANLVPVSARELAGGAVEYLHEDPPADIADTAPGASGNLAAISVPAGLKCTAHGIGYVTRAGGTALGYVSSPDADDEAPFGGGLDAPFANVGATAQGATLTNAGAQLHVRTDASARIRYRVNSTDIDFYWATLGWIDDRRT